MMEPIEQVLGRVVGTVDSRGRPRVQTVNDDPSETIQSQAQEADINEILRKYKAVGIVDNLNYAEATFMDVTAFEDYADVMNQTILAEREFLKLPSKVREIFNHDVAQWLDAAHDQEKRDELVAKGLIKGPAEDGPAGPAGGVPASGEEVSGGAQGAEEVT